MRLVALYLVTGPLLLAVDPAPVDALPASPGLTTQDGDTRWRTLPVVGAQVDRVVLDIQGRRVAVARALVAQDDGDAAAALPGLLERALAAGIDPADLHLERGLLTGVHLRGSDVLVLGDGVLRRAPVNTTPAVDLLAAMTEAGAALVKELSTSRLSPLGQGAVRRVLALLDHTVIGEDDCSPDLVRLLLRSGWLEPELAELPAWPRLRGALDEALLLRPVRLWQAPGSTLSETADAFGRRVVTLVTPTVSARAQAHPTGMAGAPPRMLVQRFAAGTDPLASSLPDSAEVWWGRTRLVQWNASDGLITDRERWRTVLPDDGPGVDNDALVDWRPPHVVLCTVDGAVQALCTTHGVLRPPASGDPAERERFLADAARLSPDAAHLDLVGQYLFSYVHDSPDPQRPWLIGVRGLTGDIHQTVDQTVATVCAGQMRGDCDDLSELYHDLLTRQGRLPQVLSLPAHAVCAWSLRQGDQWTTHVLHTGQPLAFHGETLEESLDQVFTHFDESYTDRGTMVHLLLRFAGENTRSRWQLGSRIMHDQAYARTMIAVQRDWHFHTHAHAIATMRGMLAAGDDASATWSELAGLYRRTGEWERAIAAQRECLTRLQDPATRLDAWMALIALLTRGDRPTEAEDEASDLLAFIDQEFAEDDDLRRRIVRHLLSLLDVDDHPHFHRRVLVEHTLPHIEQRRLALTARLRAGADPTTGSDQFEPERKDAGLVIAAALSGLRDGDVTLASDPELQRLVAFSEHWMAELAFLNPGDRDEVMDSYATAGRLAGALLGVAVLDGLLDTVAVPTTWNATPQRRTRGIGQVLRDLPWIRISVPYWSQRLGALLASDGLLDEEATLRVIARLTAAAAAGEGLDLRTAAQERTLLRVRLVEALVRRDEDVVTATLRTCAQRRDRRSDEMVTDTLVTMARHLPPAWFRRVLALWDEHAATKPGYFAIAWGCANADAVPQALEAGALAARRFAELPEFVAEYAYLQRVLAGGAQP